MYNFFSSSLVTGSDKNRLQTANYVTTSCPIHPLPVSLAFSLWIPSGSFRLRAHTGVLILLAASAHCTPVGETWRSTSDCYYYYYYYYYHYYYYYYYYFISCENGGCLAWAKLGYFLCIFRAGFYFYCTSSTFPLLLEVTRIWLLSLQEILSNDNQNSAYPSWSLLPKNTRLWQQQFVLLSALGLRQSGPGIADIYYHTCTLRSDKSVW